MAKSFQQIQAQIVALQKAADVARKREVQSVIRDLKAAIALYGLTAEDLGLDGAVKSSAPRAVRKKVVAEADGAPAAKGRKRAAAKKARGAAKKAGAKKTVSKKPADGAAAARFSDGAGNSWSGRGPRPGWLKEAIAQGKSPDDFRV